MSDVWSHPPCDLNPMYRIDKEARHLVFQSRFWLDHCALANVDEVRLLAGTLTLVGGAYRKSRKVAPFFCLLLKLLQIRPERADVVAMIRDNGVYVRALAAVYMRLALDAATCQEYVGRLQHDYEDIRRLAGDDTTRTSQLFSLADELLGRRKSLGIDLPSMNLSKVVRRCFCPALPVFVSLRSNAADRF